MAERVPHPIIPSVRSYLLLEYNRVVRSHQSEQCSEVSSQIPDPGIRSCIYAWRSRPKENLRDIEDGDYLIIFISIAFLAAQDDLSLDDRTSPIQGRDTGASRYPEWHYTY